MGPARSSDLQTRPKFSWDGRNVPWTDGVGPQARYAEAVEEWSDYHDLIPATSSSHIPKIVRGTILKSQLYGRAKDLVLSVNPSLIKSNDGAKHVVKAIHQRETIRILSTVFNDFNNLISAKRADNESYKNFENRFAALVSKFQSHGTELSLPEPLIAFLLLHSANLSDHQRISIVVSVSTNLTLLDADSKASKSDAQTVASIKYESVASILRQCAKERAQPSAPLGAHSGNPTNSGGGGGGKGGKGGGGGGNKKRKRMTAEEIRHLKMSSQCHYCSSKGLTRFGHWATDHNPDGSLSPHFPSIEKKPAEAGSADETGSHNKKTEKPGDGESKPKSHQTFMAYLSSSSVLAAASARSIDSQNYNPQLGPLVDDGAPYSAMGEAELRTIADALIYKSPPLESKPQELTGYDHWQYGSGAHRSPSKRILGSVEIFVRTKKNNLISIRTIIIQGSSKWVIGRNVTRKCTLEHIKTNEIRLPNSDGDAIPMMDDKFHSYIAKD